MRSLFLILALTASAFAAPPEVTIPPDELKPVNGYVIFTPKGDAKAVTYISLSSVYPLPSRILEDKRMFVLPVAGLKDGKYEFVAVASKDDEHASRSFVIVIGDATAPVKPGDPPTKPVDPPVQPAGYFFVVIRPDGPADPRYTAAMSLPAWSELRKSGHKYKDYTVSEAAAKLDVTLPHGTPLPAVLTLVTDATTSRVVAGPAPLPTTDAGVLRLPNEVK